MGEEAKTARRTDSLQKEAATMSAPNEKKSEIDETREDPPSDPFELQRRQITLEHEAR